MKSTKIFFTLLITSTLLLPLMNFATAATPNYVGIEAGDEIISYSVLYDHSNSILSESCPSAIPDKFSLPRKTVQYAAVTFITVLSDSLFSEQAKKKQSRTSDKNIDLFDLTLKLTRVN